ncbi:hypothetical protein [Nocardioides sp. BYT-33-1]|uniref:hypothetical protein n=1 Tax=Nocardioides sp. BYT-33-1 TaxID=3416952 RepID=UPI003F537272
MSAEWTAWLGPAAEEMTDEQRALFETEADAATERIGDDPDLAHEREAAWSLIVQYLLGDTTLDEVGDKWRTARDAYAEALRDVKTVARVAASSGVPEAEVARRAGLDRMQVRKLLGKR